MVADSWKKMKMRMKMAAQPSPRTVEDERDHHDDCDNYESIEEQRIKSVSTAESVIKLLNAVESLRQQADDLEGMANALLAEQERKNKEEHPEIKARKLLPPKLQKTPLCQGLSFGHHGDRVDYESKMPTWEEWEKDNQQKTLTAPAVVFVSRPPIRVVDNSWADRLARWKREVKGRDERLLETVRTYRGSADQSKTGADSHIKEVKEILHHEPTLKAGRKALVLAEEAVTYGHGSNEMVALLQSWLCYQYGVDKLRDVPPATAAAQKK